MKIKIGDVVKVNYEDCTHRNDGHCFIGIVIEITHADFFSVMTVEEKILIVNLKEDKVEIIATH